MRLQPTLAFKHGREARALLSMVAVRSIVPSVILLSLVGSRAMASDTDIHLGNCDMRRSFSDDFKDLVVQSTVYAGRGWTAHTWWGGDFGDALFVDPSPNFPFRVKDGILQIEAKKDETGRWRSGLLASADGAGHGFAQTYGYFEMRAMLPEGAGTWPAFWLMTKLPKGSKDPAVEIDALEHYGKFPSDFHSGFHVWNVGPTGPAMEHITKVDGGTLYTKFHTYGVDVEPDFIDYYFDRERTWRAPTPPQHHKPLSILLNLARGSGGPIDKTPNPSVMSVDYVRVFERIDGGCR